MIPLIELVRAHLPEITLVIAGLAALALGAARGDGGNRGTATIIGVAAAALAAYLVLANAAPSPATLARGCLALLAVPALCVVHASAPRRHYPEQIALLLFSTTGMLLLAGSTDLLTLFIALELAGLPLVAMSALGTTGRKPAESALKLFLVGALSSALLLFGISLLYGATGGLSFEALAMAGDTPGATGSLFLAGTVLVLGGFAFKLAAAPLHLWAPDVYQGGSMPAVAWIASGSKVAGFAALARLLLMSDGLAAQAAPVLALFAVVSMLVGNLAALAQRNVRRMLAYSAIGQAGYILAAMAWGGRDGLAPALFYAAIYSVGTLTAFAVLAANESTPGQEPADDLNGLWRNAPGSAVALLVAMITLAGLPPFPGFIGKFLLFRSMIATPDSTGLAPWIVGLSVALSALSLCYYLRPLKAAWFGEPPGGGPPAKSKQTAALAALSLALLLLAVGFAPELILGPLQVAARR